MKINVAGEFQAMYFSCYVQEKFVGLVKIFSGRILL